MCMADGRVMDECRALGAVPRCGAMVDRPIWQVLKYEPNQFYSVHHDQNSGHFTPQGVRIYTFFM